MSFTQAKCPSCGANIEDKDADKCEFCGALFINDKPNKNYYAKIKAKVVNVNSINEGIDTNDIRIHRLKENAIKSYEVGQYQNACKDSQRVIDFDCTDFESYWMIVKCRMKEEPDVTITDNVSDDNKNSEFYMPEYKLAIAYAPPEKSSEYKESVETFNKSILQRRKAKRRAENIKKYMKFSLITVSIILLFFGVAKYAEYKSAQQTETSPPDSINAIIDGDTINVTINGVPVKFDVQPYMIDGHIMVQIYPLAERLGYVVEWDEENQTSYIYSEGTQIQKTALKGTDINVYVNNQPVDFPDQKPELVEGHLITPCNEVVEALGYSFELKNASPDAENHK